MIELELYHGDCRAFLSNYDGPAFDAVITDPPYASGGATLAERCNGTAQKYTATKATCPYPDFAGDQMDARSWLHLMADVFALARARCNAGAVLVAFCDWRQTPRSTDAVHGPGGNGAARWCGISSPAGRRRGASVSRRNLPFGRATGNCRLIACAGASGRIQGGQRAGGKADSSDAEAGGGDATDL